MEKSENLPSGCTDWHQMCYTSADSSGNGHRLKPISPSISQGAFWGGGVLGVTKCKSLENLPNGWTDWHQIWYPSADSSRNGHRLKTISPSIHQGAFGGGGLGVKNSKVWKILPNGWTDWHQIWYTSADSSGNGHRPDLT